MVPAGAQCREQHPSIENGHDRGQPRQGRDPVRLPQSPEPCDAGNGEQQIRQDVAEIVDSQQRAIVCKRVVSLILRDRVHRQYGQYGDHADGKE